MVEEAGMAEDIDLKVSPSQTSVLSEALSTQLTAALEAQRVQPTQDAPQEVLDAAEALHETPSESQAETSRSSPILDRKAFLSLLGQHASNTWSARAAEFAIPLVLVHIFPNTLLPASVFGFATTGIAILFSRSMGRLVDRLPKLTIMRGAIAVQKFCASVFYAALLADLVTNLDPGKPAAHSVLAIVIIAGCGHALATIAIQVAIERDWVMSIAQGASAELTKLNVWLRRIDLVCKLVSPLVVSLLTLVSYTFACAFLVAFDLVGMVFELFWTEVVYRRIPALAHDQERKKRLLQQQKLERRQNSHPVMPSYRHAAYHLRRSLRQMASEWSEFAHMPVFLSSLAISSLYFTVLSFDGVMLAYFISHDWSQALLAGIRSLMVVSGLAGTLVMPLLERTFGLVRAGTWSIWSEVFSLVIVLVGFLAVVPPEGSRGPAWASALIFLGMILSRVGLWSFDLCQTKELQIALDHHPDRNAITALQISLQNAANLLKYLLTIILSKPSQFRWAVLASFVAVCIGAILYTIYARRERGHLLHLERFSMTSLLSRKGS